MTAEADFLKRSQMRISELQQEVADRERALQQKSKELMKRERRAQELEEVLAKREQVFEAQQHARRIANKNKASLIAPLLLITCIAAGYLAYEQIDQQRQYFEQVKAAEVHVDKLTRVLNLTQELMVDTASSMKQGALELERTQTELARLESELADLKQRGVIEPDNHATSLLNLMLLTQGAKREMDQPPVLSGE